MAAHDRNTRPTSSTAAAGNSGTVPLGSLGDFKVADGAPDVRGWDVVTDAGQKIGKVNELLVSPEERRVRYLCVDMAGRGKKRQLVPIGAARLDEGDDRVIVPDSLFASLADVSGYAGGAPTPEYETSLRDRLGVGAAGGAAAYAGEHYDEDRFFGDRHRRGADDDRRLVRVEEELSIDKRQVQAGEVHVHKRVETEHVRETVPVMREEVEIERRPIAADRVAAADARIGEDQDISVPVMREEVVAEKRAVPKEEVIVRKHAVQDEQVVEEDLRRERIDVDDASARTAGRRAASTDDDRGLGERIADGARDLKARVDGDPTTRPGRDADADRRF